MKFHLLFVGTKFIINESLREYATRKIEQKVEFLSSVSYFKDGDNRLFLHLEKELHSDTRLFIVASKQNFTTVGKLLCTVTSDNQILKESMLIPSNAAIFEERSYVIEHEQSVVNVLQLDEQQEMPQILIENESAKAMMHLFDEERESALALLNPLAQMYDVALNVEKIVEGWLIVEAASKKYGDISKFLSAAKQLMPQKVIAAANIMAYIIDVLSRHSKKIAFAESCTGGLLSYYLTRNNGASKILEGSLVTYSNELKENWLAVTHEALESEGAVSAEVVKQMSEGVISVSHADYSISVSGIAGDGGGTEFKPVGTVYIGVRGPKGHKEVHLRLKGDRNYVQHQSVLYAVKMLLELDKDIFF
ncbi:MAG: nicotinamide-nucleotide amidohydrolase family protein [Epsilonproteobacteria bacterium]|nr:nicotinamide-nucleotide amidohydrolase family protein [Campylobacterota bacterium]